MTHSNQNLPDRRKLALIIANEKYKRSENKLSNSIKNGRELSDLLKTINFDVTMHTDVKEKNDIMDKVKEFVKKIENGDLVLFYFAGHAYQVNAKNYLIPTEDKKIDSDINVEGLGTEVQAVLGQITKHTSENNIIFILDCCRSYFLKKAPKSGHN